MTKNEKETFEKIWQEIFESAEEATKDSSWDYEGIEELLSKIKKICLKKIK